MEQVSEAYGRMPVETADGEWTYFNRGYFYPHRSVYRGPGDSDMWRMNKDGQSFERLTSFTGQDTDGRPLPDGSMVFLSSRDGQYNVYRLAPGMDDKDGAGAVTQLTFFKPIGDEQTIAQVRDRHSSRDVGTNEVRLDHSPVGRSKLELDTLCSVSGEHVRPLR